MEFKMQTEELWLNRYLVEANSEEEAKEKILTGNFSKDYRHVSDEKDGKPLVFVEVISISKINAV